MHGAHADIDDLLRETRPIPESSASVLRCPQCAATPRYQPLCEGYGIASCECHEWPLCEGVLLASDADERDAAVSALHVGDREQARRIVLGKHARRVRVMESLGMRITFGRFIRHGLLGLIVDRMKLRRKLERLGSHGVANDMAAAALFHFYLRHRYCAPPVISAIPLLGLMQNCPGLVLDAPCGMGHLSWLLSKIVPQQQLVCMDLQPPFVYAARRFFVPEAKLAIAHDMSRPLPLAEGLFSAVFCLDAFQYVPNKPQLAREYMRILRDDGFLAITHAQNRLSPNRYGGDSLSPAEYAQLFEGFHVRLFPETFMIEAYTSGEPLDLSREFSMEELNKHPVVHLIAAKTPDVFRPVPPVADRIHEAAVRPQLNSLYRARRDRDQYVLQRVLPEGLEDEYSRFEGILPEQVIVPASQVQRCGGQLHFTHPLPLLRQQVLVDLPEMY